jgi:branched-chain amino acid transport system substrate-binding protein
VVNYLKQKGIKSVGVLYSSAVSVTIDTATQVYPPLLKAAGIATKASVEYPGGTTDYSSYITKLIAGHPEAVGVFCLAGESSSLVEQIRSAGYRGQIFSIYSFSAAALQAAGKAAAGAVWATDYTPLESPAATAFAKQYDQAYGSLPSNFAAEGYDAVQFLVQGLKEMHGYSRAALGQSLINVAKKGLTGVEGKLTFRNRQLVLTGVLAEFNGNKEVLAK